MGILNKTAKDMVTKFYKNNAINDILLLWKSIESINSMRSDVLNW